MREFYRTGSYLKLSSDFVEQVIKKYHYGPSDLDEVRKVANDIRACIKDQEGLELSFFNEEAVDVAFSLGGRVDLLLERYAANGEILKELAAENILSELMMEEYVSIARLIEEKTKKLIATFHFWGAEDAYPIEELDKQCQSLEYLKLKFNPDGSLIPAKSVVFQVKLTKENSMDVDAKALVCKNCMLGLSGRCIHSYKE